MAIPYDKDSKELVGKYIIVPRSWFEGSWGQVEPNQMIPGKIASFN